MKKVYSLVNITKAKDQEAVQSICIKVFCFGSAVTLFMGKVMFWRAASQVFVIFGRSKHEVLLMGLLK